VTSLKPDAARFAIEVLEGRLEKIEFVLNALARFKVHWLREEKGLLEAAHRELTQARREYAERLFTNCFTRCRRALRPLRAMELRRWEEVMKGTDVYETIGRDVRYDARTFYDKYIGSDGVVKAMDFYTFPLHFETRYLRDHAKAGRNLIDNAGFESPAGWYKQADLTHAIDEARSGWRQSSKLARSGKHSARFFSSEPKMYKGVVTSWATYSLTKRMGAPLEQGKRYKVWAWVNVPNDFDVGKPNRWNEPRGFFLGLMEYSESGKLISFQREIAQHRKTDGWKRLQCFYRARDPSVDHLRIRLGVSSLGEAYVDDVGIAEVTVPAQPSK